MFDRIVVGYDASGLAREAFAYALMLAGRTGSTIVALRLMEPTAGPLMAGDPSVILDPAMPPLVLPIVDESLVKLDREHAERELTQLEPLARQAGVPLEKRIEVGTLLERVTTMARPGDLVAVGMKGRFRSAGVGSTTRALVQRSPCPVLMVSGPLKPLSRIIAVFDGTAASNRAVATAVSLATVMGWPMTTIVLARGSTTLDQARAGAQAAAPQATILAADGPAGSEAQRIENIVGSDASALLVLGAYADSWLKDLFLGSRTSHILTHLHTPVLLVH